MERKGLPTMRSNCCNNYIKRSNCLAINNQESEIKMIIILKPGETIRVHLADSDGEFRINYGKKVLSVKTDFPDTKGRVGTIYAEHFGSPSSTKAEAVDEAVDGDDRIYYKVDRNKGKSK